MQRGEERPLVLQPTNESPGSLRLRRIQLWEQILREKAKKSFIITEQVSTNVGVDDGHSSVVFLYQVIRHGSIVGNSQDLCEEVEVAVSSDPQIHHLQNKNVHCEN